MPIDESGNLLDQTPNMTQSVNINQSAPPLYGEHVLDQLYADIDQSGLMTPAPQSGMSTPFFAQSRNGSSENLHSLDSVANGAVPPHALSNRLQNLAASSRNSSFLRRGNQSGSGSNTPRHHDDHSSELATSAPAPGYFDGHNSHSHSAPRSNPLSRRTSGEDDDISAFTSGVHTPEHIDRAEMDKLSKVPSYTTALRTPARGMSYSDLSSLPNYEQTMSRPASPIRSPENGITPGVHGRGGYFEGNFSSSNGSTTPVLEMGSGRPAMGRSHISDSDASRRLHLLQARGRAH